MSKKLYLDDSYRRSFEAEIVSAEQVGNGWEVVLAATCFYPESGGQPSDRGMIGSAAVLDVQLRGEEVVHLLGAEPPASPAPAEIDWPRRYDHMQQHTGQHLLTAALIELFDADTVGFHLGERLCTIDVTLPSLNLERAALAEQFCAERIGAALPVTAEYVEPDEFRAMELRKKALPEELAGPVRLVRIGDLDVAHCGGTHLRSTAELQTLKILGSEKVRDATRVHFLAGSRALDDYAGKHSMLAGLASALTCGVDDLPGKIAKLVEENRSLFRRLKKARKELVETRARSELADAEEAGGRLLLVRRYEGWGAEELKMLAGHLTAAEPRLLVCAGGDDGGRGVVVLAAGEQFDGDLGRIVRRLLPLFDGKGGGKGRFAQAVGDASRMDEVMGAAAELLRQAGAEGEGGGEGGG